MANHCCIHMGKIRKLRQIKSDIKEILGRRFGGKLIAVQRAQNITIEFPKDMPRHKDYIYDDQLYHMWLRTKSIIEIRKPLANPDNWIQRTITHELAYKYKARMTDEGTGRKRFDPRPDKRRTYREWLTMLYRNPLSYFQKKNVDRMVKEAIEYGGEIFGP